MNDSNVEVFKIAAIAVGLILFTYLIYVSRNQRNKLGDHKDRVKRNWRKRL
jgi:hypothetical protein